MNKGRGVYIDYEREINKAVLHILKQILKDTAAHGLRGEHYFYLKISTVHPKFRIEDMTSNLDEELKSKYSKDITIILQKAFEKLVVEKDFFSVILNFNSMPRKIIVPFDAIMTFHDPCANFVVHLEQKNEQKKFEDEEDDEDSLSMDEYEDGLMDDEDDDLSSFLEYDYSIYRSSENEKVVCLDDIRKKLKKV